jgi:hypothetical protein
MAYVAEISDRLHVLAHGRPGHIIDRLIAERGGRPGGAPCLAGNAADSLCDAEIRSCGAYGRCHRTMSGHEAFRYLSDILKLDIQSRGEAPDPEEGRFPAGCQPPHWHRRWRGDV